MNPHVLTDRFVKQRSVYGTAVKDDKMCIVMRLYKESMLGLMRRCPGGRLALSDVRRYGGEICKAVAELHEGKVT